MESLSVGLSSSYPPSTNSKVRKTTINSSFLLRNSSPNYISTSNSVPHSCNSHQTQSPYTKKSPFPSQICPANPQFSSPSQTTNPNHFNGRSLKPHIFFLGLGLSVPLPCFAAESSLPIEDVSNKINIEAIVVSIDDFFNRNPFFVAGVTFIWLVVIPLTQEYLQKYKFISAINAFRKLQDEPNSQMIDIRDKKSLAYLGSPNLKIIRKSAEQIEFREGDEENFVKKVLEKFPEPASTTICILDNFDGNSMKVAELLFKSGFKEAYAIRGGIRGKKGWQEIQETLLPPSVHIYPRKKVKKSKQFEAREGVKWTNVQNKNASITSGKTENGNVNKLVEPEPKAQLGHRSLSPYPNYPDLKPPSSPAPSKPQT